MNEVIKTIYERRAVRKYKDIPVSRDLIEQLLEAGRMAPSAMNKQPWGFHIVTDKEMIQLFSHEIDKVALKNIPKMGIKNIAKAVVSGMKHLSDSVHFLTAKDPVFHGAPVVVFITAPKGNEWAGLDIGMCSQNIMLAAKSLGLDSCPVGFGKFVEQTDDYSRLNIPYTHQVHLAIIIGYGDETPDVHERIKNNAHYF
nr:nitroreductase [uncultured Fluviicola sp.]